MKVATLDYFGRRWVRVVLLSFQEILLIISIALRNVELEERIKMLEQETSKKEAHINYLEGFIKGRGEI